MAAARIPVYDILIPSSSHHPSALCLHILNNWYTYITAETYLISWWCCNRVANHHEILWDPENLSRLKFLKTFAWIPVKFHSMKSTMMFGVKICCHHDKKGVGEFNSSNQSQTRWALLRHQGPSGENGQANAHLGVKGLRMALELWKSAQ